MHDSFVQNEAAVLRHASSDTQLSAKGFREVQERLGLAAEHGYFLRHQASQEWQNQSGGHADLGWKDMVIPILQVCNNSSC